MKPSLSIVISLFAVSLSCQTAKPSLKSCAAIDNPSERYACYDTLAGRLPADKEKASDTASSEADLTASKTEVIAPAVPAEMPTAPAVESTQDSEAIFGLEHKQGSEAGRPDELQLKWTTKKKDQYGKWIIIMENGQVWRQTDTRDFRFENSEQRVVISRGFAGGFFLQEPESRLRIRVKRVKSEAAPVASKTEVIAPAVPAEMPTAPAVESTQDAEAIFSLEHKQGSEAGRPDELQLKWTTKKKDQYGKWIIFLENGQVWRQTDTRDFRFKNSEQRVVISRGFAGGFFLQEPESHVRIRVKRVK